MKLRLAKIVKVVTVFGLFIIFLLLMRWFSRNQMLRLIFGIVRWLSAHYRKWPDWWHASWIIIRLRCFFTTDSRRCVSVGIIHVDSFAKLNPRRAVVQSKIWRAVGAGAANEAIASPPPRAYVCCTGVVSMKNCAVRPSYASTYLWVECSCVSGHCYSSWRLWSMPTGNMAVQCQKSAWNLVETDYSYSNKWQGCSMDATLPINDLPTKRFPHGLYLRPFRA